MEQSKMKQVVFMLFLPIIAFSLFLHIRVASAITAEVSADEDGLYISYKLGILGKDEINLEPDDPPAIIDIGKLASVEIVINQITSEPPAVDVHYILSSPFLGEEQVEGEIQVPFGEYGIFVDLMGRRFIPLKGYNIEASVLMTKYKTEYEIAVDFGILYDKQWEGIATPENNIIHEEIQNPFDDTLILDITLELEYTSKWVTTVNYKIISDLSSFNETDGTTQEGTIHVPNGSYYIWCNPDESFLIPSY